MTTRALKKCGLVALGLFLGLLALELGLRAASRTFAWTRRDARALAPGRLRILCLGESTTAPNGLRDTSWPAQLEALLRAQGLSAQAINRAVVATNTTVLLARLPAQLDLYRPHAVVAMMGINDRSWVGRPRVRGRAHRLAEALMGKVRLWRLVDYAVEEGRRRGPDATAPLLRPAPGPEAAELDRLRAAGEWGRLEKRLEASLRAGRGADPAALARLLKRSAERGDFAGGERLLSLLDWRTLDSDPAFLIAAGLFRSREGRAGAALPLLRRGLNRISETCPLLEHYSILVELARHGALNEAQILYEKDLGSCPGHPLLPSLGTAMAEGHRRGGDPEKGEAQRRRAYSALEPGMLPGRAESAAAENLRRMTNLVRERGIPFFAMQYPLRSAAQLQKTLIGIEGARIISNDQNFRAALRGTAYDDLFIDRFAGDFGHCTPRGDRLIAEAAARALSEAGVIPQPLAEGRAR